MWLGPDCIQGGRIHYYSITTGSIQTFPLPLFSRCTEKCFYSNHDLNILPRWTHLTTPRLVFDVLSGTDLGFDILQIRHGRDRSNWGTRSEGAGRFGWSAHHSYLLHLLSRCAAATGRRFRGGRAAATATIRSLRRFDCGKVIKK